MKKKVLIISFILLAFVITVYAAKSNFKFDTTNLSFANNKSIDVVNNFKKEYKISSTSLNEEDEEIKELTKKATYLLFGKFNGEEESSADYYKRRKDFFELRYNPEIPKDESNILGLDTSSQEYKDDTLSGIATATVFNLVQEKQFIYNSYGDITISKNDDLVIAQIILPNVKYRIESKTNPYNYVYEETDFIMSYYYKKLNGKYKIWYVWGMDATELEAYQSKLEDAEISDSKINSLFNSSFKNIYNFDKLNKISDAQINSILESNKQNVVIINGSYGGSKITNGNGFFISNGLVITTWDFVEKSLMESQFITMLDYNLNPITIKGIVTANPELNVAILKVEDTSHKVALNMEEQKVEDPVFSISSGSGLGLSLQKGIIINYSNNSFKTTIPISLNEQGRPMFNENGEVIGMSIATSKNSDTSSQISSKIIKEIYDQFKDLKYEDIDCIPFEELKEKYYYVKISDEQITNTIPAKVWKKYSKIGDIKTAINLELTKASYKDGIVSLRYKNTAKEFVGNMLFASTFIKNLKNSGYTERKVSDSKYIYQNGQYKVILLSEFDYLIVVMQKL